jgi:DNA polymerase (family 10)
MDNKEISLILKELAVYKELAGENVFKIRAFENAARVIENYPAPMIELLEQNTLNQIKGIGKSIAEVIVELVNHGTSRELDELKLAIPEGLHEMLSLEGMGPKRVRAVWQKLGVTSIGELEYACQENRLLALEGFGEKSQAKILKAIEQHKLYRGQFLFSEALNIAEGILKELEKTKQFEKLTLAGSLRRGKAIVKDADILVVPAKASTPDSLIKILTALADDSAGGKEIISAGDTKVSIRRDGLQVDFRIIPPESYASALQHFSGSKEHNTLLRSRAKAMGFKMNEYGFAKGEQMFYPASEEEVYKFLNLAWIPPELREGEDEIEAADRKELPELVRYEELKGMIHVHSNYSDGLLSIGELARECAQRGFSYLCLSDHSRSAYYAHGLSEQRLLQQIEEIKKVNEELKPFKVFAGIESDILADGSLDYPPEILKELDFVIGAVHSKLSMSREEATERLVKAVKNPYLTILAHASGRLLLSREGYTYDEEKLLDALAEHGVVLEHNCNPHRLDPGWQTLKKAGRREILVALSPDAHDAEGLDHIRYGQIMASKAWLKATQILNCKSKEEINEFFRERKRKAGAGNI